MPRDRLLLLAVAATVGTGAAMVLAPGPARLAFALLMFGEPARMDAWPAEARAYATLAHGVMGGLMVGWGLAMALLLRGPWAAPPRLAWRIVAASVAAWYLADTGFSAAVGAWPNVALNTGFGALFALGLWRAAPHAGAAAAPQRGGSVA